ncbi:hypothetical protein TeGR_g1727 [Tetraparma gracilis]|uniref:MAPEG family protein n=1 Tax=Tetraparma gracilis TaxID=2962635 RepID=A0ABQ6N5W5_9STRA|nr:hypothetical protein TeGR_g1727 [Tetraparma gracilis]
MPSEKNALASALRSAGLTFDDCGFFKLNAWFPVLLIGANVSLITWCRSNVATLAVAMMPVPEAKVPFFVIAFMPIIAIVCTIVAIQSIAAIKPRGAAGRIRGGSVAELGLPAWIDRLQQAQYNTWECCTCTVCTFFVAVSLGLPDVLFAKMATFLLLVRVLYVLAYVLDLDFVRTLLWLAGTSTCLLAAFAALFPESVAPVLA